MRCQRVRELLSPYIDLVLTDEERNRVEEHLAACESCRKDLAELQSAVNRIREMEKFEAPSDFMSKLHERLLQEKVTPLRKHGRKSHLVNNTSGWLVASVASVALVLGIYISSLLPFPVVASFFDRIPQFVSAQDSELRNNIEKFLKDKKQQMQMALNNQQQEKSEAKSGSKRTVNDPKPQQVAVVPKDGPEGQVVDDVKPILISTVNLELPAEDIDQVANGIKQLAEANGAKVETHDSQLMAGQAKVMTVRVPQERVSSIVTGIRSFGCPTQPMHATQDLTQDYKNIKKRIGEVKEEIARLQSLEELNDDESNKLQAMLFEKSYLEDKLAELEANTELVAVTVMITEEPNH